MDSLPIFDNIIGDGAVIATPFGSTAYYSSIGGVKFEKGIGIALNNPYNSKSKSVIIDDGFDPKILITILRDDGLLLFDNSENIIKIKEGDDIKVEISKINAKFVTV